MYYFLVENRLVSVWSVGEPPEGYILINNVPPNFYDYLYIDNQLIFSPLNLGPNWSEFYKRVIDPINYPAEYSLFNIISNSPNQIPYIRLADNLALARAGNSNIKAFNACISLCLTLPEFMDQSLRFSVFKLMKDTNIPISFNILNREELENENENYLVFPLEVRTNALDIILNNPGPPFFWQVPDNLELNNLISYETKLELYQMINTGKIIF